MNTLHIIAYTAAAFLAFLLIIVALCTALAVSHRRRLRARLLHRSARRHHLR